MPGKRKFWPGRHSGGGKLNIGAGRSRMHLQVAALCTVHGLGLMTCASHLRRSSSWACYLLRDAARYHSCK
jgi:hypothetical protein